MIHNGLSYFQILIGNNHWNLKKGRQTTVQDILPHETKSLQVVPLLCLCSDKFSHVNIIGGGGGWRCILHSCRG